MELKEAIKPDKKMELQDIIKPENLVYDKSKVQNEVIMHYCPGCSHGGCCR